MVVMRLLQANFESLASLHIGIGSSLLLRTKSKRTHFYPGFVHNLFHATCAGAD